MNILGGDWACVYKKNVIAHDNCSPSYRLTSDISFTICLQAYTKAV